MRLRLTLAAAAALLAVAPPARAADPAAIKEKAETCFACHGPGGVSQIDNVPSLAGQPDLFTQWQLVFFRNGRLKNDAMTPIAEGLSDEDVRDLGGYFARLPPPPSASGPDEAPALTELGAKLSVERHCSNCHTESFAGTQAAARLAGQREEYLLKALHDYKAGTRTGTGVASMPEVAFSLTEDEMKALAHYLARHR